MSPLSDNFPEGSGIPDSLKTQVIPTILDLGMILKTFVPDFKISYDKFIVVIAISKCGQYYGCVPINTEPEKYNDHAIIKKDDHPWLDYDSHICCNALLTFNRQTIDQLYIENPIAFKGNISDEQLSQLHHIVKNSRTIVNKVKTNFGLRY